MKEVILTLLHRKVTTGALSLAVVLVAALTGEAADRVQSSAYLSETAVSRSRPAQVIGSGYLEHLSAQPTRLVKVWVFFTDKGISDKAGFDHAAASVSITERALKRRAKVGLDRVVFLDLPVVSRYVADVESLGGHHRRSSRWLNAASFEIEAGLVEQIARLPFVAEIRPVMGFKRGPEPEIDLPKAPIIEQSLAAPHSLNYGLSFAQLNQLNVPAAHDLGYSGLGVTLAILDTGCRKTHIAFAQHFADNRVLAEYDFVHNDGDVGYDPTDGSSEHSHGTKVWASAGGWEDGEMYGPAYQANFILCKTEDTRSETNVEEDNWVAAMEFADSIGTDVISTSLGYKIFDPGCSCDYTYKDLDGQTTIISTAASLCDGLGIVFCNSAGNSGSSAGSITAPADALDILAVGAVTNVGGIASFSSRGPTYDGRIKPEVCAQGIGTRSAVSSADFGYTSFSGTSASQPLIAGCVALVIQAHPDWTPHQVREALKASGNRASNPDNTYGWGIIDVSAAIAMDPPCCRGKVGDVNALGGDEPTISDVAVMIDMLYISGLEINCLTEADINLSGGGSPVATDITLGDISILIDHLYISQNPLPDCP